MGDEVEEKPELDDWMIAQGIGAEARGHILRTVTGLIQVAQSISLTRDNAVAQAARQQVEIESLRASLTRVEEERDTLRVIVERGAQSVALMAWEIPAPNIHTQQLIALAQSMTSAAQEARLSRADGEA